MRIVMIGAGYVGLVSGACFAEFGVEVVVVDKDRGRIDRLNQGVIPIYEPGLEELVARNREAGRITFTTDLETALQDVDAVFIAVGTPSRRGDGHADLTYVFAAAEEVARALDRPTLIVTKSTVPVGTSRRLVERLAKVRPDLDLEVASNPEFLREGSAIEDFMRPDRVVCGVQGPRGQEVLARLYRPLNLIETPILFTSLESAELIKYATNCFLATKISFINEMAELCERVGADVQELAKGIGLDGRIGRKFLHAGPGYGGSCLPKDTLALVRSAEQVGLPMRVVGAAIEVNEARKRTMVRKILDAIGGNPHGRTVCLLGVTFKPNTDDMRESPSLVIVPALQGEGVRVQAFDPAGTEQARPLLPDVVWHDDPYAAMEGADALVILTEWNAFRSLDLTRVKALLKRPLVVDLRNVYRSEDLHAAGFEHIPIGRPPLVRERAGEDLLV